VNSADFLEVGKVGGVANSSKHLEPVLEMDEFVTHLAGKDPVDTKVLEENLRDLLKGSLDVLESFTVTFFDQQEFFQASDAINSCPSFFNKLTEGLNVRSLGNKHIIEVGDGQLG